MNASIYTQFKTDFPDAPIETHIDLVGKTGKKFKKDTLITISSLESIKRTGNNQYGLIILDEFESILNHYESDTFKYTTPYDSLSIVKEKLLGSNKILTLDADLSEERLTPIYKTLGIDEPVKIYYSNNNKWKDYKINIILRQNEMRNMIETDIQENKKLTLAFLSKTDAEAQNKVLRQEFPDKNILCIWSGLWEWNGVKLEVKEQENIKKDIENFIVNNNIDIWIYTPSVKTGLSFNHPTHFDKTYMTCNNTSCVPREAIQMLFRTRNLNQFTITIFLPKLSFMSEEPSRARIQSHLIGGVKISILGEEENIHSNKDLFKNNDFYKEVITSNKLELFNRNSNFSHTFLQSLIIKHQIPIKFIYEEKTTWGSIEEAYKEAKKQLKHEKVSNLMEVDLLPIKSHKELQEARKNYQYNNEDVLKLQKRTLFNESGISGNTYEFTKYGNYIERYYNRGTETTKDEDGNITTIKIDKSHQVEKNSHLLYDILTQNHQEPKNIYFNNCIGRNTQIEEAINNENIKYIHYAVCKRILTKILPEFYTKDGDINLNTHRIPVLEFNNRMKEMEEEIKKDYNQYQIIKELKDKMDWSKFKASNSSHKKIFYHLINNLVKTYGMKIITPKNSGRKNSKYCITRNTTKIGELEYIFIHKSKNHNGRKQPIIIQDDKFIITDNEKRTDFISDNHNKYMTISSTGVIMINKTKKQKEYCKNMGILDDTPIQLYQKTSSKWEKDGEEWKKNGVNKTLTTNNNFIDIETKIWENKEERESERSIKSLVEVGMNNFYSQYRIKKAHNPVLKKKYYFNIRKEIQPTYKKNEKIMGYAMESDSEDDEIQEISEKQKKNLNNGVELDTDDEDY